MHYILVFLGGMATIAVPCLLLTLIAGFDLSTAIEFSLFTGSILGIACIREVRKTEALWRQYEREFDDR